MNFQSGRSPLKVSANHLQRGQSVTEIIVIIALVSVAAVAMFYLPG